MSATSSSQSTSKSSGALYRPEGYLHTTSSTSTSGNVPSAYDLPPSAGIAPYGWQPDRGMLWCFTLQNTSESYHAESLKMSDVFLQPLSDFHKVII